MTMSLSARRTAGVVVAAALALAAAVAPGSKAAAWARVIVIGRAPSERAVARAGGIVGAELPLIGGYAARVPQGAISRLAADPDVRAILPDPVFHLDATSGSGTPAPASTQTNAVDAPKAWSAGYRGKVGVNVAVLDSGIAPVDDLAKPSNRIVAWKDFVGGSPSPVDPYGHGTYVAGVIAGNGTLSAGKWKGVAPEAGLIGIRVFDAAGIGSASTIIQGIQWAIDNRTAYGIRVLNMAFSTNSDLSYRLDAVTYAAERAWMAGIVVVASAGNQGPLSGSILSPGIDPYVVTVGSVAHQGTTARTDDTMASSSGAGPTLLDRISKPDLVAPGEWDTSLRVAGSTIDLDHPLSVRDTYYFDGAGTSPAAGVVSGAVALMLQKRPTLVPDQIKYVLKATTTAAPSSDPNVAGAGYVNAYNATVSKLTAKANVGLIPAIGGGLLSLVGIPDVKMR